MSIENKKKIPALSQPMTFSTLRENEKLELCKYSHFFRVCPVNRITTFTTGYGLPSDWENTVFDLWLKLGLDFPVRNYVGYLNDKPVSTACILYGGGAAGSYLVATLPETRGKGIGAALTLQPLQDARGLGYRIGTL